MERIELFRKVCLGNEDASNFLMTIVPLLHLWDDLIDKDKPVSDEAINAAFWDGLVTLPRNRFYREHFDDLNPILAVAIQNWQAANLMERERREPHIAFIIRSSYVDLITMSALLCGGPAHAARMTPLIREFAHSEGFDAYLAALGAERTARGED